MIIIPECLKTKQNKTKNEEKEHFYVTEKPTNQPNKQTL